ncbi:MAG: CDP-glucose 4,6-dehydratase [Candidatus Marinamargulisbacteria bacterium]
MLENLNNTYNKKKVLVTGHTGFKGSWLCQWLLSMGANVTGISKDVPTSPSLFDALSLSKNINDIRGNIKDLHFLSKAINEVKPDVIFHLAAQPIVKEGIQNPVETFLSNSIGTMNLLESIRLGHRPNAVVLITSDKAYRNNEWDWGYRESDELGGDDPYSASKGCAELIIRSYINSYFNNGDQTRFASARAGNVIGGGDWSEARIVPDAIKAWTSGEVVTIRSPKATRPWQHVLEPLGGYLNLGQKLLDSSNHHGESFNFGPKANVNKTVEQLLTEMAKHWSQVNWEIKKNELTQNEHGLLKLCCDKALTKLNWEPTLNFEETVDFTVNWYKTFYDKSKDISQFTLDQIEQYQKKSSKSDSTCKTTTIA